MILYHAISTYQLLEMILHRKKYHLQEKAVLMVSDTLNAKFPVEQRKMVFFDDVWIYKLNIPFVKGVEFEQVIDDYFNQYFASKQVLFEEFEKKYIACAHFYLGHYLEQNEIPYTFFEDAAGMLSRPDILIDLEKTSRPFKCERSIERGLYDGMNRNITSVVCNIEAQQAGIIEKYEVEVEDFNVVKELMLLTQVEQEEIISFFTSVKNFDVDENTSILLTQHFAGLRILSFDEQVNIYQAFTDYFFSEKEILIKTHPDDIMYYGKILDNVSVINEKFPSEFLPCLINGNAFEIASISSTAINNFRGTENRLFELNTDFEKTFHSIHKYFVALQLVCELQGKTAKIDTIGCDLSMLKGLITRNNELEKLRISESDTLIVDDYLNLFFEDNSYDFNEDFLLDIEKKINNPLKYKTLVFLNSQHYYSFYHQDLEIFKKIIPVEIEIILKPRDWWEDEKFYIDKQIQTIYIYSEDEQICQKVKEFRMQKELASSEKQIQVREISDLERKIYQGQIKALETRLNYYIELNKKSEE